MTVAAMTTLEKRAAITISMIMGLRMIGLFMVLPVFSLYADHLTDATPFLIGLAMGTYGLAQAICQITFGALSDKIGRKPAILAGLLIFTLGSLLAGYADSIYMMIIGRTLQGMGAIGSTTLALLADLTREDQRSKSMMIIGITIGFSFSLAMLLGPLLTKWVTVGDLFYLAALLALVGIAILYMSVPNPATSRWHRDTEPELHSFLQLLRAPDLARLNIGVLVLHAVFTAIFIVVPISLYQSAGLAANQQWEIYLPALLIALVFSMFAIGASERKQQVKHYFLGSILFMIIAEIIFWLGDGHIANMTAAIALFFTGFTILESFLPSLVSRTAPASCKGSAMGLYSCAQYLGIFVGGVLGGWLYSQYHFSGVYAFCISLTIFWLLIAFFMRQPRYLTTRVIRLAPSQLSAWPQHEMALLSLAGMAEVTLVTEENMVYTKMERKTAEDPDFIRLKELLQSNIS